MAKRVLVSAKKPEAKRENRPSQTQKASHSQSISSPVEQILFLQRTIGNQAVGRLIKSGALQAKLKIGQPGDMYEREADRIAEQVMRMPEPQVSTETKVSNPARNNPIQRKCPGCNKGTKIGKEEEEEKLQKKEASGSTHEVTHGVENSISALRGGGQPLPEYVGAFYGQRFGHDFSNVRVHTDSRADASTRSVDAFAFTLGSDISFRSGHYSPHTQTGQRLLAHELTHVVQQRGGSASLGIRRAPFGIARGIAGNCIGSADNCTLGTDIHRFIQGLMVGLYSPAMFAEVAIPGGGTAGSSIDCQMPGFVDLYGSWPIGIVPAAPQGRMFPAPIATFPLPAPVPGPVMVGSIKPFTTPTPVALADLLSYITALDAFAAASGSMLSIAEPMIVPTNPSWALPGLPFPFSPATLPQMIHIFTTMDGMYWYFCRPMIELAWLAARAASMIAEMMDKLKKAADKLGQQIAYAFEAVLSALAAAAHAVWQFLEEWGTTILAIVALIVVAIIVVVFWEVIVAAIAAAAAAIAAFFAEAAMGLAALAGFAALLLLLLPSEASAAGNPPPSGKGSPAKGAQPKGASSALGELLNKLQGRISGPMSPQNAMADTLRIIDDAEKAVRLVPGGDMLVHVLKLLRHVLKEQRQQAPPPRQTPVPPTRKGAPAKRQTIKLIEGLNLEKVVVGRAYIITLDPGGQNEKLVILQATKKIPKGKDTTVEFTSRLECGRKDDRCSPGGNIYTVTHPYRPSGEPEVVGRMSEK
ncbi:hypothetical protein METP3_00372 [Methanosarcinales archaeon]|nr:hypothetical protein METP3_00372 [Methanosarcinales archaeon]